MCGRCSVEELRSGFIAVLGHCCVGESWCGEVAVWGSRGVGGRGVGESRCVRVPMVTTP